MITVISSIIGFFSAGIPSIFEFFQDKSDKEHELKVMQLQMQMAEQKNNEKLDIIEVTTHAEENIAEITSIYKTYNTGIRWVDAFNGSVRPVIAYLLIGLYCVIEYMIFHVLLKTESLTLDMLEFLWSDEDHALFVAIISYYFGSRSFNKKTT